MNIEENITNKNDSNNNFQINFFQNFNSLPFHNYNYNNVNIFCQQRNFEKNHGETKTSKSIII